MTESEVESIISDLMLGATDTTALTLVWILYVLATNQSIQVYSQPEGNPVYTGIQPA